MKNPQFRANTDEAWSELSATLLEMRDALIELSLSLKDWQFDTDLEQRKATEDKVRQLLTQIASTRHPSS